MPKLENVLVIASRHGVFGRATHHRLAQAWRSPIIDILHAGQPGQLGRFQSSPKVLNPAFPMSLRVGKLGRLPSQEHATAELLRT